MVGLGLIFSSSAVQKHRTKVTVRLKNEGMVSGIPCHKSAGTRKKNSFYIFFTSLCTSVAAATGKGSKGRSSLLPCSAVVNQPPTNGPATCDRRTVISCVGALLGLSVHGGAVDAGSSGAQRKSLVFVRSPRQICSARWYKPDRVGWGGARKSHRRAV